MSVIDKISSISETLSKVFQYAQKNPEIKEDFDEYLKTIGAFNAPASQISSILVTYVFERAFLCALSCVRAQYAPAKAIILEPRGIELPFKPSGKPFPLYLSS